MNLTETTQTHEIHVRERYDATPFTAWFDHYFDGHIHLGYWPNGAEHQSFAEAAKRLTRLLIDRLGAEPNHRVLDVGSGVFAGPAIQLAQETGCEVDGVTLEENAVRIVPERAAAAGVADKVRVHVGRAQDLPFPSDSFDGAWAVEMFIHVPDKTPVLQEVFRVLRPGAKVVIADFPAGENFTPDDDWILGNYFSPSSIAEFERLTHEAGFESFNATDLNDEVAVPTFQQMLDYLVTHPQETRPLLGDDLYEGIVEVLPDGVRAHQDRALSYGIITASKP